ncbi:formylglycine-generating enzyme family protein [Candidatus Hydrogenedentota bacterium]
MNPTFSAWRIGGYCILGVCAIWLTACVGPTADKKQATGRALESITLMLPGGVPLEMVRIPAGSFEMGSRDSERNRYDNEGPAHRVDIAYDFYIGKYPVTQSQWLAVMGDYPAYWQWLKESGKHKDYGIGADHPIYNVAWKQITGPDGFLERVNHHLMNSEQGASLVRLPSESEWEYACRGRTTTCFSFVDSHESKTEKRSEYMWFYFNSSEINYGCKPVGQKKPNPFGLYDMHGNLWEFCRDRYHLDYDGAPTDGSAWEEGALDARRVIRGGSWLFHSRDARSACRMARNPSRGGETDGFRVALNVR